MSTNDIHQTSTPDADICGELRTKSGQGEAMRHVCHGCRTHYNVDPIHHLPRLTDWCAICSHRAEGTTLAVVKGRFGNWHVLKEQPTPPAPAEETSGQEVTGTVSHSIAFRSRDEAIRALCMKVFGADPVFPATPPAERPTPITDAMRLRWRESYLEAATVDEILESHADLERQLAEAIRREGNHERRCDGTRRQRHSDNSKTSITTMENPTDDGAALPIHDLFSVAGDTPETDQLLECDQHKVDEDSAEYSAYRRMVEHAQALERRLNVAPSEKEGCARLMEEAEYEIFDVVDDGQPVVIELHPGHNGRSSYLFWRPLKDHDEAQLWEFVHDSPGPEIRNVSFLGEPAKALRKFITEKTHDQPPQ